MLINPDLSPETAGLTGPQNRTGSGPAAATAQNGLPQSPLDSSLQRLTDAPADVEDADWAIQDEAGADQATSLASLHILQQPGAALASQANQLSQNVLSLLQPADS